MQGGKIAKDETLRLIVGIFLVLIALPAFVMVNYTGNSMIGYGMMGTGGFNVLGFLAILALLVLGIYLIADSLKGKK